MHTLTELHCPECQSLKIEPFKKYNTVHNGERSLFKCDECDNVFSETASTPMQDIKSPISKVASVLKIRSEGMGLRATGRVLGMHKKTVSTWERLFGDQKETLMLYSFCHEFVSLVFEGDELYTVVGRRTDAHASEGWTAVIMERSSRFIVDQQCGAKDASLFESVMSIVCKYISQTGDLSFYSDGERRYGNTLFAFCAEALRNGKPGRSPRKPSKVLKLRIKNRQAETSRVARNINVARSGRSIRHLSESIPKQIRSWTSRISMRIMSKRTMRRCAGATAHLDGVQTRMPRRFQGFSAPLMCIG